MGIRASDFINIHQVVHEIFDESVDRKLPIEKNSGGHMSAKLIIVELASLLAN